MARAGTAMRMPRRLAGASQPTHRSNDAAEHARQGSAVIGWVNEKTGIGTNTILTDATLVYNLRLNERVCIVLMLYGLASGSDDAHVEIGYTDQADGAGSFTPLSSYRHFATGQSLDGFLEQPEVFGMPRACAYSQGARSVTFRVTANDTDAEITLEWSGWIETED